MKLKTGDRKWRYENDQVHQVTILKVTDEKVKFIQGRETRWMNTKEFEYSLCDSFEEGVNMILKAHEQVMCQIIKKINAVNVEVTFDEAKLVSDVRDLLFDECEMSDEHPMMIKLTQLLTKWRKARTQ